MPNPHHVTLQRTLFRQKQFAVGSIQIQDQKPGLATIPEQTLIVAAP